MTARSPASPPPLPFLPVDEILPALLADLSRTPNAVLRAPPGAGKTTRVPLALLGAPWLEGRRVFMLEPRRLAARNAARFMARALGEEAGGRVGYRMRLETRVGPRTRIEVLTEGVLTRMAQEDPGFTDVGCVIFDEFHERSLNADLALALCLEVQAVLRPDLRLLVMSATLDGAAVADMLGGCPIHVSEGRLHPVEVRYAPPSPRRDRPLRMEEHAAAVTRHALERHEGDVLVFLPGTAEIRRVEEALSPPPPGVDIYPLYGDLPPAAQDAALAPCPPPARKVVLATAIAETSLTIQGVRVVVDAGLDRRAVFDPTIGMGRLTTGRTSLAGAAQRAGRAGREAPGTAYRLWAEEENASLRPFARAEILEADLAPLVLQLAVWGTDPGSLRWMDPPPEAALRRAREVLRGLEALDEANRPTAHGRTMAALPLHPRLAHMTLRAEEHACAALACCMAALAEERPTGRAAGADIRAGLERLCRGEGPETRRVRRAALYVARLERINFENRHSQGLKTPASALNRSNKLRVRLRGGRPLPRTPEHFHFENALGMGGETDESAFFRQALRQAEAPGRAGRLLALAWPEWLAQRVGPGRFRLRCGRAAALPLTDPLAQAAFLGVAALDGGETQARIHAASPLTLEDVEELFAVQAENRDHLEWDAREEAVLARRRRMLGALTLDDRPLPCPPAEARARAVLEGIAALGLHALPWTEELRQWQARVLCLRRMEGEEWPEVDDAALLRGLPHWLGPFVEGVTRRTQFRDIDLAAALHALLPPPLAHRLEELAPTHVTAPSGSRLRIDYAAEGGPVLAVKLQEMFGCADTPRIAGGRLPLTLHLRSPAGRPLQVTRDLRGFWQNGYAAVRAEMRGRYPRHPWPEDPLAAAPTRRAKPRKP